MSIDNRRWHAQLSRYCFRTRHIRRYARIVRNSSHDGIPDRRTIMLRCICPRSNTLLIPGSTTRLENIPSHPRRKLSFKTPNHRPRHPSKSHRPQKIRLRLHDLHRLPHPRPRLPPHNTLLHHPRVHLTWSQRPCECCPPTTTNPHGPLRQGKGFRP